MEELTILDAPSMERLLIFDTDGPMNISIVGAPNLRVLGSLPVSSLLRLQLGSTVFQV
jgi:hypothetical protein